MKSTETMSPANQQRL